MVTETETLTSTLHHNIFTYLDYVYSVTFIYIYIFHEGAHSVIITNISNENGELSSNPRLGCLHFIYGNGMNPTIDRGCPRGVMVKAMDCGIVVSEFVLQSHYYVHFRANTLGKGMNPLILPAMG